MKPVRIAVLSILFLSLYNHQIHAQSQQPEHTFPPSPGTVTYTAEEIAALPVHDLYDLLRLHPEMNILTNTPYQYGDYEQWGINDVRMRGGRQNEIALYVDGVPVRAPLFGDVYSAIDVHNIERLTIIPGGHGAEYGNALSGVIDIRTKAPGETIAGYADMSTSNFGFEEGAARNERHLHWGVSGPVPKLSRLGFSISGEFAAKAHDVYELDDIVWDGRERPGYWGTAPMPPPTSLEIMERYAQDGAVVYPAEYAHEITVAGNPYGQELWINPLDNMKGWQGFGWDNHLNLNAKLRYEINPKMDLTFDFTHGQTYAQPSLRDPAYFYRWPVGDYMHIDPINFNQRLQPEELQGDPEKESWGYNRTGMAGRNVSFRDMQRYTVGYSFTPDDRNALQIRFSLIKRKRKVRILTDYNNKYAGRWNVFSPDGINVTSKEDYQFDPYYGYRDPWEGSYTIQGDDTWYDGDESSRYLFQAQYKRHLTREISVTTGLEYNYHELFRENYNSGSQLDCCPIIYRQYPSDGAAYGSINYIGKSIRINASIRTDYQNTNADHYKLVDDDVWDFTFVRNETKERYYHSPRIALQLPITDHSVLFSNISKVNQLTEYEFLAQISNRIYLYTIPLYTEPRLRAAYAVVKELGYSHNIQNDFLFTISYSVNESENEIGIKNTYLYNAGMDPTSIYIRDLADNNASSRKVLSLTLQKEKTGLLSGYLKYSHSNTTIYDDIPIDMIQNRIKFGYYDFIPNKTAPWDRPHTIRAMVTADLPEGYGPKLLGGKPLENAALTLLYYGESGMRYTAPGSTEENGENWPFSHRVDLEARKRFTFGGQGLLGYLRVTNLLGRKNAVWGYPATGQPDDPGPVGTDHSITYWDARTATHYGPGRGIDLGIRFSW